MPARFGGNHADSTLTSPPILVDPGGVVSRRPTQHSPAPPLASFTDVRSQRRLAQILLGDLPESESRAGLAFSLRSVSPLASPLSRTGSDAHFPKNAKLRGKTHNTPAATPQRESTTIPPARHSMLPVDRAHPTTSLPGRSVVPEELQSNESAVCTHSTVLAPAHAWPPQSRELRLKVTI